VFRIKLLYEKTYPSDLTDSRWNHIRGFFEKTEPTRGRPQELDLRRIVNACFCILVTGCQWRYLPKDYPNRQIVYYHFRKWKYNGLWKRINDTLRPKAGIKAGKHKQPTAGSMDSQSVKNSCVAGESHGFDAGKKTKGRKRHIVVDTLGFMLAIIVTSAAVQDRDGAKLVLNRLNGSAKKLRKIWVDGGYRGLLLEWGKVNCRFILEVVLRSDDEKGFVVLPRRWVAERTFAWLVNNRRMSKDYERFCQTSETFAYMAMSRLMLKRLAPS
jgi:putative transposase